MSLYSQLKHKGQLTAAEAETIPDGNICRQDPGAALLPPSAPAASISALVLVAAPSLLVMVPAMGRRRCACAGARGTAPFWTPSRACPAEAAPKCRGGTRGVTLGPHPGGSAPPLCAPEIEDLCISNGLCIKAAVAQGQAGGASAKGDAQRLTEAPHNCTGQGASPSPSPSCSGKKGEGDCGSAAGPGLRAVDPVTGVTWVTVASLEDLFAEMQGSAPSALRLVCGNTGTGKRPQGGPGIAHRNTSGVLLGKTSVSSAEVTGPLSPTVLRRQALPDPGLGLCMQGAAEDVMASRATCCLPFAFSCRQVPSQGGLPAPGRVAGARAAQRESERGASPSGAPVTLSELMELLEEHTAESPPTRPCSATCTA